MKKGRLILIPSALAESNGTAQFPQHTLEVTFQLIHFITERAKTARHFLKSIDYPHAFDGVVVMELNKHGEDNLNELLQFCEQGIDTGLISEAGVPGVHPQVQGNLSKGNHGFMHRLLFLRNHALELIHGLCGFGNHHPWQHGQAEVYDAWRTVYQPGPGFEY